MAHRPCASAALPVLKAAQEICAEHLLVLEAVQGGQAGLRSNRCDPVCDGIPRCISLKRGVRELARMDSHWLSINAGLEQRALASPFEAYAAARSNLAPARLTPLHSRTQIIAAATHIVGVMRRAGYESASIMHRSGRENACVIRRSGYIDTPGLYRCRWNDMMRPSHPHSSITPAQLMDC